MFSLANIGRRTFVTAAVIAISCGVTFYAVEKHYENHVADLENQIDSLSNKMLQVRVSQRVSDQMEDIAAEQTKISNLERDRAEAQSKIAQEERNKAEIQRKKAEVEEGLARKSQNEALASAAAAKKAQEEAEWQKEIALNNELIARDARAHADTLLYLSLSNSLALSSINQYNSNNHRLAALLSYASWHYNQEYGGAATVQQSIYQALLNTAYPNRSNVQSVSNGVNMNGEIRKLHVLDNGDVTGVTDYGDVFYITDSLVRSVNIDKCNFRDFYTYGKQRSLAICADGSIVEYDLSNITSGPTAGPVPHATRIKLPPSSWKRIIGINHGQTIVAMSENKVAWIDSQTMTLIATVNVPGTTTCLGKQGSMIHIFCGADHYISSAPGELISMPLTIINYPVTAYIYNKEKGLHCIGLNSGEIVVLNENGEVLTTLTGHSSPITDLHLWGNMLGSSSYDMSIRLWNIGDFNTIIAPFTITYDKWIHTFDVDQNSSTIWVGTERGNISSFCSDIKRNAELTKKNIKREFTPDEWKLFVGNDIPQYYFMK